MTEHHLHVLTSLFHQPSLIDKHNVDPSEFTGEYQMLAEKLSSVSDEAMPEDRIKKAGKLSGVDVASLLDNFPHAFQFHLEEMRAANKKAAVYKLSMNMDKLTPSELQERLEEIAEKKTGKQESVFDVKDLTKKHLEHMKKQKELMDSKGSIGIITGYTRLDKMMPIQPGQLILLAARPSVGKSAMAINMGLSAALYGHSVLYISIEMNEHELMDRMMAFLSKQSATRFKYGTADLIAINKATADLQEIKQMHIAHIPGASTRQILKAADRYSPELLVIDHVDLINLHQKRGENEASAYARMTGALKVYASAQKCSILALSQFNRQAGGSMPMLHQLRGSGAKEQDSDGVLILHRDLEPDSDEPTILRIAKNRSGVLGDITMSFDGPTTTFKEV